MNYYEKIIQEKQNGNLFLEKLRTKSFRSADELERAIKSYVAGGRVISDDSDGFTVEAIEDDGKHTYKIYLREDGGTSERVTVEKVVKLNSKGETNMGYYADLIKEKRNEKSERFMFMGKSYNVTLKNFQQVKSQIVQDFKKEVHRLEIEMMKTIGQEHFEIKEELESFKDGFKESTLWQLDKLYDKLFFGSKDNEKENESKSQIEKRIKDAEERVKLFQRLEKEVQAKLEEGDEDDESRLRRQRESYRDGIAINQSLIEHLKKELKTAKNEKEEKGYYAKLSEEKASRKN